MRHFPLLVLVLFALVPAGIAGIAADTLEARSNPAGGCLASQQPAEELLDLWYDPAGTPGAMSSPPLEIAEEGEVPEGNPADPALVEAIEEVAHEWVACTNAGAVAHFYTLFSDDLALQRGLHTSVSREDAEARLQMTPTPLGADASWAIGPAQQARILPDGRVGAAFVLERGGIADNVYLVFERHDGRWQLDAIVRLAARNPVAPVWGYRVVAEYPHDPEAYTQGLVLIDGVLYEGTGLTGRSSLRRVDLESGEVLQIESLDDALFGEGVAVLEDRVYQLTWTSGVCFVYDRESFELQGTFSYGGEGWGLTTDGRQLIMSDGSNRLVFRDPETFEETGRVDVYDGDVPVSSLNELEYVDGEVWANVYQTDRIARIDPLTGDVTGWIDLTGLLPESVEADAVDVLNGIAHDPETGRIFVTGKLWPTLFEIELVPPR